MVKFKSNKRELAATLALEVSKWTVSTFFSFIEQELEKDNLGGDILDIWSMEDLLTYGYDKYTDQLLELDLEELLQVKNKADIDSELN